MVESLMLVTGLLVFQGWLDDVRPIEHCPQRVVAVLAQLGSEVAVEELEQRCGSGKLSPSQRHRAADICLEELSRRNPSPAGAACISLLTQMNAAQDLDSLQSWELNSWLFPNLKGSINQIFELTWPPQDTNYKIWDKPGRWTPPDVIGIGSWTPPDFIEMKPNRPGEP